MINMDDEKIYNNLCTVYGQDKLDKFIKIMQKRPNSCHLFDIAYKTFGIKAHYVIIQLGLCKND